MSAKVIKMETPQKKRGRKPGQATITVEAGQVRLLKMILEHGLDSPALTTLERAEMYPLLMRQSHMLIAKHMDWSAPDMPSAVEDEGED